MFLRKKGVIVICQMEVELCLSSYLKNVYDGHIKIQVYAPSSVDEALGTADVLRKVQDKIKVCYGLECMYF